VLTRFYRGIIGRLSNFWQRCVLRPVSATERREVFALARALSQLATGDELRELVLQADEREEHYCYSVTEEQWVWNKPSLSRVYVRQTCMVFSHPDEALDWYFQRRLHIIAVERMHRINEPLRPLKRSMSI